MSFSLHRMRTIRSPSPLLLHPFSKKILAKLGKLESESATTTFLKIYFSQVSDCSVNDKCEKYFRTPIKTVQQLGAIFAEKFPLLTEFLARWKWDAVHQELFKLMQSGFKELHIVCIFHFCIHAKILGSQPRREKGKCSQLSSPYLIFVIFIMYTHAFRDLNILHLKLRKFMTKWPRNKTA